MIPGAIEVKPLTNCPWPLMDSLDSWQRKSRRQDAARASYLLHAAMTMCQVKCRWDTAVERVKTDRPNLQELEINQMDN